MRKWLLMIVGIFLLGILLAGNSWAQDMVYPLPPPNDTSLNVAHPQIHHRHRILHRAHHRHHYRPQHYYSYRHHSRHSHRHRYAHHKPSLYLYYSLPGTACCGDTWQMHKTREGAEYGVWPRSPYATFEPAPDDFIYSATNNDDMRYDPYRDIPVDDTIENPDYY